MKSAIALVAPLLIAADNGRAICAPLKIRFFEPRLSLS